MTLKTLLAKLIEKNGSDLHLKVGSPPTFRINGVLHRAQGDSLKPADIRDLINPAMTEEQKKELEENRDIDFAVSVPGLARFRASLFYQRGTVVAVFRAIPMKVPQIEDLGLPGACKKLADYGSGLILVTGPTGSGKSSTLAAMIDYINKSRKLHILTLEDPIEFLHKDQMSLVNQRQVGSDALSFSRGVIKAMREDPDVIMIGEMRDTETIEAALTAAETGHLVLGTLHTSSAIQTIERVLDIFPGDKQDLVRFQLSTTLQGILSQKLVPGLKSGRVAIIEVLMVNQAIRNMIRESKTHQILSQMQSGKRIGMISMEDAVADALERGLISQETAERVIPKL